MSQAVPVLHWYWTKGLYELTNLRYILELRCAHTSTYFKPVSEERTLEGIGVINLVSDDDEVVVFASNSRSAQ